MYLTLFFLGGLLISQIEGLPLLSCLFEAASAVGTVGLSLGLTPGLGTVSRIILILLMYFGRVGGLTLIFAAFSTKQTETSRYPQEKLTVG
jgi:trk system potassium uptake protein TrkH